MPSKATQNQLVEKLDLHLLRIALVFICGGVMSILDTTIVNVSIKSLSREFASPLATVQWVSTAYLLALATVIPITGWGADRFGTKRLYIVSLAVFVAGSALSAAAWSAGSLIVFRVIQGLGGGMIIPVGMTILTHAAGPSRVGRIMAISGGPMLLAPIFGPVLGGYLVDSASWRWIFIVNLPIGGIGLLAAAHWLDADEPRGHLALDWLGLALLSPGLTLFVAGLSEIASTGQILSATAVGEIVGGLALVCWFIWHALRRKNGLLDVRLIARRTVAASAATTFLFGGAFFGTALALPLYFQTARGLSAVQAGWLLAIQGLGAMIAMPIAGKLSDKNGAGKIVMVGLFLSALGLLFLCGASDATPWPQIELALFLMGCGSGSTMMPAMSAALAALKHEEVARATSALNAILRVGGSIGTAFVAMVLTHGGAGLHSSAGQSVSANQSAGAYGDAFLWSLGIVLSAVVAALFLPRIGIQPRAESSAFVDDVRAPQTLSGTKTSANDL
jgi:EmrB/QacA subfamily drug resistance transporter